MGIKCNNLEKIITKRINVLFEEKAQRPLNGVQEKEDLREYLRTKMQRCRSIDEDVMRKYYGIDSNMCRPIRLDERISLDRIINKHGSNGYISISASRSAEDDATNARNTQRLISDIRQSGYSFLPTYGGYRSKSGEEIGDYEPSFLVFNYNREGENLDFDNLYQLAIEWCGKYNQDSVMIKAPNIPSIYVNRYGEKVNKRESNRVFKNDPKQQYFTSLKDKTAVEKEIDATLMGKYKSYCHKNNYPVNQKGFEVWKQTHLNDVEKIGRRFTNDIQFECYINPIPQNLNEMMRRGSEIYLWS